ncbi:Phosphatidylglycerol/phosphatidylinositol transfer protein, partial [Cladochytrium tenue]
PQAITLTPDPPRRGRPLTVSVVGELSTDVVDGAWADVTVKLGLLKLVEQRLDLCKESEGIGRQCPYEQGYQNVTHTVDLPREVPPGRYTIAVHAANADDAPLACLAIQFRM